MSRRSVVLIASFVAALCGIAIGALIPNIIATGRPGLVLAVMSLSGIGSVASFIAIIVHTTD